MGLRPTASFGLVFVAMCWSLGSGAAIAEKQFLLVHKKSDPRFLTSIERAGPCTISSDPVSEVRVPSEIYPQESVDKGETGVARMELVFDAGWCVRRATIIKSTGYWRLDQASLSYLMTVRYKPDPEAIKIKDGESTLAVTLEWRSGVCGGYKKCLLFILSPAESCANSRFR